MYNIATIRTCKKCSNKDSPGVVIVYDMQENFIATSLKRLHVLSSVKHLLEYEVLCLLWQSLLTAHDDFFQPVSKSVGLGTR